MVLWDSISLAQSLRDEDLSDEYQLVVCLVLGGGRRLFPDDGTSVLELREARNSIAGPCSPTRSPRASLGCVQELARLDATAQAELVRRGELTPLELVDAAIDQDRKREPCAERSRDPDVRSRAGSGARRAARRPLPRRPLSPQGSLRVMGRRPDVVRFGVPEGFRGTGRQRARAALPGGRARLSRQDELRGVRLPSDHRAGSLRPDAQPVGRRPHAGRLERRLGRGGRFRDGSVRPRQSTAAARSGFPPPAAGSWDSSPRGRGLPMRRSSATSWGASSSTTRSPARCGTPPRSSTPRPVPRRAIPTSLRRSRGRYSRRSAPTPVACESPGPRRTPSPRRSTRSASAQSRRRRAPARSSATRSKRPPPRSTGPFSTNPFSRCGCRVTPGGSTAWRGRWGGSPRRTSWSR